MEENKSEHPQKKRRRRGRPAERFFPIPKRSKNRVTTPAVEQRQIMTDVDFIKLIRSGEYNPRNLKFDQRKQIISILRDEGLKNYEIANLLKVTTRTVEKYINRIKAGYAYLVDLLTVKRVGGNLIRSAEIGKAICLKSGNTALYWKIEVELTERLQSMGFVYRAPEDPLVENHTHITYGWQTKTESDEKISDDSVSPARLSVKDT